MIDFKNYERVSNPNNLECPYARYCEDGYNRPDCKNCSEYKTNNRLIELENLIEQGKLVEKIEPKSEMAKEQEIKEMGKLILETERHYKKTLCLNTVGKSRIDSICDSLYYAGYRKQEEIEKQLAILEERNEQLSEKNDRLQGIIKDNDEYVWGLEEEVKKQIAKEILEDLLSFVGSNQKFCIVDNEHKNFIETNGIFDLTEKIAKKYGVEVE